MFIFTRRNLQQMIESIAEWMPEGPLAELIDLLNAENINRLPQMWELAWLYALGSVVRVEHERPLPEGKPDLWFTISDGSKPLTVVADITCLSDSALHAANPFEQLSNTLHQQARKVGIRGGGFHVSASHVEPGPGRGKKVQLLIPSGPELEQLTKRHLKPFVRDVSFAQLTPRRLEIDEPRAKFVVEYKGPGQYSGGSHRSYDSALSLETNVLFNRLRDKTRQLRGAPAGAVRMLVICDGGCALLSRRQPLEGYNAKQIAQHFLRRSQTIDLVLLVTVVEERTIFARRTQRQLVCDLVAAVGSQSTHMTDRVVQAVWRVFDEATRKLPVPNMMPNNALRRNFDSDWSASMAGNYVLSGDQVKVSARAVLELLAGTMSYERFCELHRWNENEVNFFRSRLASGQLFRSAKIERLDETQDDDWIEFEFGPPDPAVSAFRLAASSKDAPDAFGS